MKHSGLGESRLDWFGLLAHLIVLRDFLAFGGSEEMVFVVVSVGILITDCRPVLDTIIFTEIFLHILSFLLLNVVLIVRIVNLLFFPAILFFLDNIIHRRFVRVD